MALTKVFGFAVIKGGPDLPSGYDENTPFGFDKGEDGEDEAIGPIFNYSINDVEDNFNQCYTMSTHSQLIAGTTLRVYAEVGDNVDLKSQEFVTNADWKKAFKIIEWTIVNQSAILTIPPTDSNNFINYADERLAAELINSEVNKEKIDNYVLKSFGSAPSTNPSRKNRIGQFTFQALIDGQPILFTLFLDADDFCNSTTEDLTKSIFVWWFDEITWDGKLDNQELDEAIIDPITGAFGKKNYRRKDVFATSWYKRKNPNDPSQGYETEAVVKWFFIFSNFKKEPDSAFPVESRMEAVRQALIDKFGEEGLDGNKIVTDDLIAQYPELFTRNEVLLIPFGNNNSMVISGGELIQGLHPITPLKIINSAKRFGFSLQTEQDVTSGKSKSELFFAGGETPNEGATNIFRFPILAIEKTNKNMYPISSRFPNYVPKYFDQDFPDTGDADKFQFLLVKALGVLENKYTDEQLNSVSADVKFTVFRNEEGIITSITFVFNSVRWILDNSLVDDNIR